MPFEQFAGKTPEEIHTLLQAKIRECAELSVLLDSLTGPAPAPTNGIDLTPKQAAVLSQLTRKPQKGAAIAAKLKWDYDSTIRGILSTLVRFKLAAKGEGGGYVRCD